MYNSLSWGLGIKEFGFMTIRLWEKLYKAYKLKFDNELVLKLTKKTYAEMDKKISIDDVIPF